MIAWWSGLLIGFLGSLHCVGMCGPIALALPGRNRLSHKIIFNRLQYHGGRVLGYALLGALVGILGQGALLLEMQQYFSIFTGVLLILLSFHLGVNSLPKFALQLLNSLKRKLGALFRQKSGPVYFHIGLLNSFLPCGLTYIALATAMSQMAYLDSVLFMAAFGMGTFPAMMLVSMGTTFFSRQRIAALYPALKYLTICLGCLLVLRGLGLGIPYLSMALDANGPVCH